MTENQDLRVAMVASLQDRLVAPLRRTLDAVERNLQGVQRDLQGVQRDSARTGRTMAEMSGPLKAARQVAELARGTQHATTLAERLERAWGRTGNIIRGVSSGVAAFQAARFVLTDPMSRSRDYGLQVARAANTAFGDRDQAGWTAGVKEINDLVVGSLRTGGGTRDSVLAALNEMLSSGQVNATQARTALPIVAKYSTASGADPIALSQIVVRALQAGFKEADIGRLLDMALVAGQKGGFELKDMAAWLPRLMAAGTPSGLRGFEGYGRILASAEASLTTAGSRDEAGNNLLNLLTKINSADTANDAKKLGIDLRGTLADARDKGMNSLDAFVALVDKIAGSDPRLVELRKRAATTTGEDRLASLRSQADILEGGAVGKIVQDRQALLALVAEMNQRGYIKEVMGAMAGANGQVGQTFFDRIATTPAFQVQQMENANLIAQDEALQGANEKLGLFGSFMAKLYEKYPGMAAAAEGTKLAVTALGAAAAGAAGALLLLGGGRAAAAAGAGLAGAAAMGAGGAALNREFAAMRGLLASGSGAGAAGSVVAPAAGLAAVPLATLGAGVYMSDRLNSPEGLVARINTRNERLRELAELSQLDRPGKYDSEIAALTADRDALRARYGALAGGGRGMVNPPVNVNVYLDGQQIQSTVNGRNDAAARRN